MSGLQNRLSARRHQSYLDDERLMVARLCVAKGVQLLDSERNPARHWRAFVTPERIRIASFTRCPGGMIFGRYDSFKIALCLGELEAVECGFNTASIQSDLFIKKSYPTAKELDQAWREALTA